LSTTLSTTYSSGSFFFCFRGFFFLGSSLYELSFFS